MLSNIVSFELKMYENILRFVFIEFECWFNGMFERENSWGGKREKKKINRGNI